MSGEQGTPGNEGASARFTRVLMLLPRGYRQERGEEILGTLLDAAQDEGRSRPSAGEVLSILGLALSVRTGAVGESLRTGALEALLRRVALAGLFLQSAIYTIRTFTSYQETNGAWRLWLSTYTQSIHDQAIVDLYVAVEQTIALVAVSAALYLLASGRRRSGFAFAAVGPLTLIVGVSIPSGDTFALGLVGRMNGLYLSTLGLGLLTLVAAALAFGSRQVDEPRSARPWLIALVTIDTLLLLAGAVLGWTAGEFLPGVEFLYGTIGLIPAVVFAARAARTSPTWPLALLATGAPGLALLPRTIIDLGGGLAVMNYGASGMVDALGTQCLVGEVLFAAILAWSLYRHRHRTAREAAGTTN
ncbi:MAG TPA: hypothetical protein VFN97_08700 [Actinospica sp.]|nr:hypothetical protein [Actinospica sp.]